jgi:hypothetical protein
LTKELPYGFDKFSRLLPPEEALGMLWALEMRTSWREAAGGGAGGRGGTGSHRISREATDLLDRMLDPDESSRISLEEAAAHPWLSQRLPARFESALKALADQQAQLDAARAARASRDGRSSGGGGSAGTSAGTGGGGPSLEAAVEQLLEAVSSPDAVRQLCERGESLYVDLAPDRAAGSVAAVCTEAVRQEPLLVRLGSRAASFGRSRTASRLALDAAVAAVLAGGSPTARLPGGGSPVWRSDSASSTPRGGSRGSSGGGGGGGGGESGDALRLPLLALGAPAARPRSFSAAAGAGQAGQAGAAAAAASTPAAALSDTAHGRGQRARAGKP